MKLKNLMRHDMKCHPSLTFEAPPPKKKKKGLWQIPKESSIKSKNVALRQSKSNETNINLSNTKLVTNRTTIINCSCLSTATQR